MKKEKRHLTFFSDFKKFIFRGNIMDLAVAVIIGAAFGKIVTSLVNDIIMPMISLALGGINFSDLKWVITPAEYDALGIVTKSETALAYGNFIQTTVDFLIIALCIFIIVRVFAGLQRRARRFRDIKEEVVPAKPTTEQLLTEIRDLLAAQQKEEAAK